MSIDFLISILAGLASLAAGGIASSELIQKLIRQLFGKRGQPEKPYTERFSELTSSLTKASQEIDTILAEITQVARHRQDTVKELEVSLSFLESREKELKEKIEALEKTPIPVAEHFAKLIAAGERRSTKRDYALFGAGVVLTTLIAILIQVFAA